MSDEKEIKWLDLNEFVSEGYLQEVNRRFFHPLGLAMSVTRDDETGKVTGITGFWDYRDDPEGIIFGENDGELAESRKQKCSHIQELFDRKCATRKSLLGYDIQEFNGI